MQSKKVKRDSMKGVFLHISAGKMLSGFVFFVDVMGQLCSPQINIT